MQAFRPTAGTEEQQQEQQHSTDQRLSVPARGYCCCGWVEQPGGHADTNDAHWKVVVSEQALNKPADARSDCVAKLAASFHPAYALFHSLGAPAHKQVGGREHHLSPGSVQGHWYEYDSQKRCVAVG